MEIGDRKISKNNTKILSKKKITREEFDTRAKDLLISVFGSLAGLTIGSSLGSALSTRISSSISENSTKFKYIYDALEGTSGKSPWLRTLLVGGMGIAGIACALSLRDCSREVSREVSREENHNQKETEIDLFT